MPEKLITYTQKFTVYRTDGDHLGHVKLGALLRYAQQVATAHAEAVGLDDALYRKTHTAYVLAKLAHGIADDMLTTTVLACDCPKIAAPAMNTRMYENPVTQDNLALLRHYGWEVIEPASGRLACGAVGKGKLPEPEEILQYIH